MRDIPIYTETIKPNYPEMLEQNIQDTKILAKALLDVLNKLYVMDRIECASLLKEYSTILVKMLGEAENK